MIAIHSLVSWTASVTGVFYALFNVALYWRDLRLVKDSHLHHVATVICRVTVFPGWLFPVSFAAELLTGNSISPGDAFWAAAQSICLVGYSYLAWLFLTDDDWWSGLGKRLRRWTRNTFTIRQLTLGEVR